ncbi:hypothetical protein OIE62_03045 [Streptomyces scopuliridis]|uniref:Uncharacterized protein n=2 Tax=Streptomyces scopuliridis TaxID=452529 RepID=A0A2T7T4F2_9ACTN|nr:hypothetical protein [Streptomyces scopuliridis]PVE10014.1 hypothetical protein Y717_15765 [Streptomyces scopuliridis RB72]WSC02369.1 hypothetical protein OG835_38785 [Streptomyces scopuliridis]WSC04094.1 hypothetical protein OIE62_03045 [Streptomyces scopuliridis]
MAALDNNGTQAMVEKAKGERERLETGRSRVSALVTLAVVGGIALLLALVVGGDPNEAPSCDDRTMTRDDVCVIYSSGGGGSYSYQEMIDRRESGDTVKRGIGFGFAGLCAVLMIPAAMRLDPSTPWGTKAAGPCPRCGGTNLREKKTTHSVSQGRTTYQYTGVVTLCTPACGFSSCRRP